METNIATMPPQNRLPAQYETQTALMAAQAKALVEARYTVAINRPRDMLEVQQKLEKECKRPNFAKSARYFKPLGKGITGLSIRFAEAAMRIAGNISSESLVIFEDSEKRQIKVIVTDLETNAVSSQDVIISKTVERLDAKNEEVLRSRTNSFGKQTYTVKATEDDVLNKQNAAISKTKRNLILSLLPGDISDNCLKICTQVITDENAKDPEAAKKALIEAFFCIGVKVQELAAYLGHSLDTLKPEEMMELQTIGQSIKDGETTWKAVMESKTEGDKKEEPKESKNDNLKKEIDAKMNAEGKAEKTAAATLKKPGKRDDMNAYLFTLAKTHKDDINQFLGLFGCETADELKDSEIDNFMKVLKENLGGANGK